MIDYLKKSQDDEIAKKYDIELVPAKNNEYFRPAKLDHKAFRYTKKCIKKAP